MSDAQLKQEAAKLKPKAVFDHRHSIMYEESVAMGVTVLTRYFAALQRRDLKAMAKQMNFPHASVEASSIEVVSIPFSRKKFVPSPIPNSRTLSTGYKENKSLKANCQSTQSHIIFFNKFLYFLVTFFVKYVFVCFFTCSWSKKDVFLIFLCIFFT